MNEFYEIRVSGQVDPTWSDWFDGLSITHTAEGETVLSGTITDQAALHGILDRVRDLNLNLVSVTRRAQET